MAKPITETEMNRMIKKLILLSLVMAMVLLAAIDALASADEAWKALSRLDIPTAKKLFNEELAKNPHDFSLMRGIMIASFFDLDHKNEVKMADEMIAAQPDNPYLLSIYEHISAEMSEWKDQLYLQTKISDAFLAQSNHFLNYAGMKMKDNLNSRAMKKCGADWQIRSGAAPGCWISGPYDNLSNIALYRKVQMEGEPLDTLKSAIGKRGSKAAWSWLPACQYGILDPDVAVETEASTAFQIRAFFQLPKDMEILILPGGNFGCRASIDGKEVFNDATTRNSYILCGLKANLDKGNHEITYVLAEDSTDVSMDLRILDTDYQPIPGFKWLRFADVQYNNSASATPFHPLFDTFENMNAKNVNDPDYNFWKGILYIHNGYAPEIVDDMGPLFDNGQLSLLDAWVYYSALYLTGKEQMANSVASYIKEKTATAITDFIWISRNIDNYEESTKAYAELEQRYPGRCEIEMASAGRLWSDKNYANYISAISDLEKTYPQEIRTHFLKAWAYRSLGNYEDALKEFAAFFKALNEDAPLLVNTSDLLFRLGKYDKSIKALNEYVTVYPVSSSIIARLANTYIKMQQYDKAIGLLTDIVAKYPLNITGYSYLYEVYKTMGDYPKSREYLKMIHQIKPSAVAPYAYLDELHNNVPYDSIFGSVDASRYWDKEPTNEEKAGSNSWRILDRSQKIVFSSGVVYNDFHTALIVGDQDAVKNWQETELNIDFSSGYNSLLVARRLRKGQAPLSASVDDNKIVFKDLRPGDAIEIRYRTWSGNDGDLWQHFWDSYPIRTNLFQRYWEYTIYTNRDDLRYAMIQPVPDPDTGTYCGFKKLSWRGEKTPGTKLDLGLKPPSQNILGNLFVTTVPSWDMIGNWYLSISDAILDNNPITDNLTDKLIEGKTGEKEKLETLYSFVVSDIPYQVISLNYHGSIPHKPDDVLINRWGDCKDKGHLLIEMLRRSGITAWPVLVATRSKGTQMPLPQFCFDHLIVGSVIDGDTVFIDPADAPYPPLQSISSDVVRQPCLMIKTPIENRLASLPALKPRDFYRTAELDLSLHGQKSFNFSYATSNCGQEAGSRRYSFQGIAETELKNAVESGLIDSWGIEVSVDSFSLDPIDAIDSVHNEYTHGVMALKIQSTSGTTILNLPDLAFHSKSVNSDILFNGKREYPVDLRGVAGERELIVKVTTPAEYGMPELPTPIKLSDSLCSFTSTSSWDNNTRQLTLKFREVIFDGLTDPQQYIDYVRKVNETLLAPILYKHR
jgi:tetratricopeptide (TPR) repeat protein